MKKTLLLDMDGILVDLHLYLIQVYNERNGTSYQASDLPKLFGDHEILDPAFKEKEMFNIFNLKGFFRKAPPVAGAIDAVKELQKQFDIYVVTTPWMSNPHSFVEKCEWLRHYMPGLDKKIVLTWSKEAVFGDILVDDRMKNLVGWKTRWPTGKIASLDYHWLQKDVVDIVEPDWQRLAARIMEQS